MKEIFDAIHYQINSTKQLFDNVLLKETFDQDVELLLEIFNAMNHGYREEYYDAFNQYYSQEYLRKFIIRFLTFQYTFEKFAQLVKEEE